MNWETYHPAKKIVLIIGGIILGVGVAILVGFIIMWLWNGLMPKLFGLTEITYWQGIGLALLGRLLFGGVGSGNSKDNSSKRKGKQRISHCEDAYEKVQLLVSGFSPRAGGAKEVLLYFCTFGAKDTKV
jgi:high-affinity Fe2+/Pb2+ permease